MVLVVLGLRSYTRSKGAPAVKYDEFKFIHDLEFNYSPLLIVWGTLTLQDAYHLIESYLALSILSILFYSFWIHKHEPQTEGQSIFGQYLINADGSKVSSSKKILHSIVGWLFVPFNCLIPPLWVVNVGTLVWSQGAQTLTDFVCNILVVADSPYY